MKIEITKDTLGNFALSTFTLLMALLCLFLLGGMFYGMSKVITEECIGIEILPPKYKSAEYNAEVTLSSIWGEEKFQIYKDKKGEFRNSVTHKRISNMRFYDVKDATEAKYQAGKED